MIVHLDVLGTGMKHWIGSKSNARDIVTPKNWNMMKKNMKLTK